MADTVVDSLQIEINAKAQTANDAIDALADKLDILSNSLGKLNNVRLDNFFNSLKGFQGSKLPDFARLANGISKLSNINYNDILNAGQSLRQIASQLQSLGGIKLDDNVVQIANVANAMSKLGGKSIVNATNNVPLLANALNQLMVTLSKAPTVNQSVIDMTNALTNLAAQGSKVGSASASVVNGLNRTNAAAKRASGSTMSLARAFGKFYANYFLLVRGFKGMFNMMESAMELTETVNYFEVTLRNIGESAKENWKEYGYESADAYADSFAQRLRESNEKLTGFTVSETGQISQSVFSGLGISPATATQYSAMFAQVANSIGMTEEASIALSEAFVRLGADWASLRNVDFEVAYEKLASGLSGQSRALRAFGIDITMATLQEIAFANGIEKSVSEMTQSEKSYLRLIAIIEQSEVAFGDLANTLQSPANQMRYLSQGVQNLGTLIGNLFLPLLQRVLPVLNGFVIALQRIVIAISEAMGIDTSGFNTSLGGMDEGFGDLSDSVDEATESAEKFNRATRGWDELNVLGKDTSKGYGVGNDLVENEQLLDAYDDAIEKYRKAWEEAYDNINNEAEEFADRILSALNIWDKDKLYKGAENFGENIAEFLNNTITVENFRKIGDTVGTVLETVIKTAISIEKNFDFGEAGRAVAEGLNDLFANLDGTEIADGLNTFADGVEKALIEAVKNIEYDEVVDFFADLFDELEIDTIALIIGAFTVRAKGTTLLALLGSALKKHLVGEISLSSVAVNLKGIAISGGSPAFDMVGSEIVEKISDAVEDIIPDWAYDLLSNLGAGLVVGAAAGSWFPGAGTVAGAIVGAIVGALKSITIDGKSILSQIFKFDNTSYFLELAQNAYNEAENEFNKKDWLGVGKNIVKIIGNGIMSVPSAIFEPIWNVGVLILNGIEKALGIKNGESVSIKAIGKTIISSIAKGFENNHSDFYKVINYWYNQLVKPWFSEKKWTFDGVKTGLKKAFENAIDAIKGIWNTFAEWINNALNLEFDGFSKTFSVFGKKIEVGLPKFDVQLGKLPTFQTGGFPEDGLFMANHNELVGKFSNGKTAVANNDQITKGIEEAAYRGMTRALATADFGAHATFDVKGDPNGLFSVVQKQATQYTKSTGKNAFGY